MDENFSWVDTHKAITKYLRTKEHVQQDLIDLLKSVGIGPFNDVRGDEGHDNELDEIDPFTFFCYIYKYGPEKRLKHLQQIAEKLGIEIPTGESGIPSANAQKVWLFPYKKERTNNEIERLWSLFNKALGDQITNEDFADALSIKNIGKTKLTEALFYVYPEKYFPINGPTKPYIKEVFNINPKFKSYDEYWAILNEIKQKTDVPFYELSYEAWHWNEASKNINYWIFQGNPKVFDFETALRDEVLSDWTVSSHKEAIKIGDKVILWITGNQSGCYALAEVTSEPHSKASAPDDHLWKEEDKSDLKAELKITHNLIDRPILKSEIEGSEVLKGLKAGYQGTNFSATEEQYQFFLEQISAPTGEETFLEITQSIPKENLITFFSLLDELMDFLGIKTIDKRLSFSCRKENRLILIVGHRYCLDTGIKDGAWGFISKKNIEEVPELVSSYPFDGEPSAFYIKGSTYEIIENQKEKIFEVIQTELARTKKSSHRNQNNNAAFEKAVFDLSYRRKFMDFASTTLKKKSTNLNTILFGPPGTGKTYSSKSMAVVAIDNSLPEGREAINARYHELVKQERIQFVTFHQSTTYEDFVEGIKPIMENEEDVGGLTYQIDDGIFKKMCVTAAYEYIKLQNQDESVIKTLDFSQRFNQLMSNYTERLEKDEFVEIPLKSGGMISVEDISSQGNFILKHQEGQRVYTVSKTRLETLYNEIEDFDNIPNIYSYFRSIIGGSNASAYWAILNQIYQQDITEAEKKEKAVGYEEKRKAFERINWESIDPNLSVPTYFLVVDEINRGNIAAILGELITLLEEDKRGGNPEYLEVVLPYSKKKFSVPPNLHILGTMNTADRSVEALDTALRRRFAFQEIQPNPELLKGVTAEGIDLEKLLMVINGRIRKLLDKDHMIGHAYFLPIKFADDPLSMLKSVFHTKILPLLQEYFYGNFGKIQLILGRSFVDKVIDAGFNFAADAELEEDDFLERTVYEVKNISSMDRSYFKDAVMKIYKPDYE